MLVRWAVLCLLLGVVLALSAALVLEWSVVRDVVRERDALERKVAALNSHVRDAVEESVRARSIRDQALLKAPHVDQADLVNVQAALAAANLAVREAGQQLAVEKRARETAESNLQDAREQWAREKANILASIANSDAQRRSAEAAKSDLQPTSTIVSELSAQAEPPAPAAAPKAVKAKKEARPRKKHSAEPASLSSFGFSN